jgi:hypothetical protein
MGGEHMVECVGEIQKFQIGPQEGYGLKAEIRGQVLKRCS